VSSIAGFNSTRATSSPCSLALRLNKSVTGMMNIPPLCFIYLNKAKDNNNIAADVRQNNNKIINTKLFACFII
jgi:hypothetical protein